VKPTLSVILPNYNHARFLPTALEALLSQSHPADEILIIDDASQDESVPLIESYARKHPTIHLIRNKKNVGPSCAVTQGVQAAKGDYVAFCAADDKVLPSFFETALSHLKQNPQVGLFSSKLCFFLDGTPEKIEHEHDWLCLKEPKVFSPEETVLLFRSTNFRISTPSSIFKRSSVLEMGGHRDEAKMISDWLLNCQIALHEGFIYVPQILASLRVFPQAHSYSGRLYNDQRKKEIIYSFVLKFLHQNDPNKIYRRSLIVYQLGWDFLRYLFKRPRYWFYLPQIAWKKYKLTYNKLCKQR
jgi:glycosyltransferase involved in cell wall biosynthesis